MYTSTKSYNDIDIFHKVSPSKALKPNHNVIVETSQHVSMLQLYTIPTEVSTSLQYSNSKLFLILQLFIKRNNNCHYEAL